MIEMRWALPGDREAIIDFIDYVFSKSARPHDFATLLPKLYGGSADTTRHHYIILEDGKIVAAILAYPVPMVINSVQMMTIGVGSVSVHPRARGRGYMQALLSAVDARAKELGAAFSVLGGQRQRYGYYGYVFAGMQMGGSLTRDNVRHAMRDVDVAGYALLPMTQAHVPAALALHDAQPCRCERSEAAFPDILRSWDCEPWAVMQGNTLVGFASLSASGGRCHIGELVVQDEHLSPALKLLVITHGTLEITAAPWQTHLAKTLTAVCEGWRITGPHAYKFYDAQRVCSALGAPEGSLSFDGFSLPLPLCVPSPDCV